jgi:hypothetical protein
VLAMQEVSSRLHWTASSAPKLPQELLSELLPANGNVASTPAADATGSFWLNIGSGSRHNEGCRYYKNTKRGKPCGANEGRACGICGG